MSSVCLSTHEEGDFQQRGPAWLSKNLDHRYLRTRHACRRLPNPAPCLAGKGCSAQQQRPSGPQVQGEVTVSAVLDLSTELGKPGLDGWSGQGQAEGKMPMSTSLHGLSPVALPYRASQEVPDWTTSSDTAPVSWMLGRTDRLGSHSVSTLSLQIHQGSNSPSAE